MFYSNILHHKTIVCLFVLVILAIYLNIFTKCHLVCNKKVQLTPQLAHNSATIWRIRLKQLR